MVLPSKAAVITLPSATLFPQALLPLYIFEPRYRKMLADALLADRMITVAMQRPGRKRETPCTVAGLGLIRVSVGHEDGTSHLVLQGITRVELMEPVQSKPYPVHSIRPLQAPPTDSIMIDALVAKVHELVTRRLQLGPCLFPIVQKGPQSKKTMKEMLKYLESLPDADQLADLVSCALLHGNEHARQRQTILETVDMESRLRHLIHFLMAEIRRQRKDTPS